MTSDTLARPGRWAGVKRWGKRIILALVALIVVVTIAGSIYEALGRRTAGQTYPPPGRLVDVGGRTMHLDCRGAGSPTVVLESGLGSGGSVDWSRVHDQIAQTTRTCAYDRAGIMWSAPKDTPQDARAVARDLNALLSAAGISGPLVLVGHSIGGPYVRVYTALYGERVAGLVMVDPSHPDQVARLGKLLNTDFHPSQMMGTMRIASALSWSGVVRIATAGNDIPNLPKAASASIAAYSSGSVNGMNAELAGFDRTMDQTRAVTGFGKRPLLVLTAMAPNTPEQLKALKLTPDQGRTLKQTWKALHAEIAGMSTRRRQQIVADAGHYIQIDRPDRVVAAVRSVVATVRADEAAPTANDRSGA